jgi:hypothetical protein
MTPEPASFSSPPWRWGESRGCPGHRATRLANVAAAVSLSREGLGLPSREEVDETMRSIRGSAGAWAASW